MIQFQASISCKYYKQSIMGLVFSESEVKNQIYFKVLLLHKCWCKLTLTGTLLGDTRASISSASRLSHCALSLAAPPSTSATGYTYDPCVVFSLSPRLDMPLFWWSDILCLPFEDHPPFGRCSSLISTAGWVSCASDNIDLLACSACYVLWLNTLILQFC